MEPDCDNNNDDNMSCLSADTEQNTPETKTVKPRKPRVIQAPLKPSYTEDKTIFEIGVDEVGRGPLFGRVYTAAVILPKDGSFDCSMVKDSKKFAETGGWGFAHWEGTKLVFNDKEKSATCFACHMPMKDHDYVYTAPSLQ